MRSVVALLLAVFTSATAAMAGFTALGKHVYGLTGNELDLGFLGLIEFAPAALLVVFTGSLADRYDRRRVAAVSVVAEAACAVGLGSYIAAGGQRVGPIFLLVLALGVSRAFLAPASRSLPADIVPAARLPWLIPRQSAAWQASVVTGPLLGGFLYTIDPTWPFFAMAALLILSAFALLFIRVRAAAPREVTPIAPIEGGVDQPLPHGPDALAPAPSQWHEALEGLRFIRRHQLVLGAISLDLFAVLFGGAVALLPAIAEDRLGVDAVGLGWLRAAGGIGAAVVTLALAIRPLRRHVGRKLLVAVATFGVATIALGLTRSFLIAFVAMAVLSAADAVSVFVRATLVPLVTPAEKRGRVLAVENVFIGASNELGAFESGVAGQVLGAAPAIVLGGAATLVVAGVWWKAFPALRDVDEFPNEPTAT
jgi:MFS family permease